MHNRISTIIQARQEIQSDKNLIGYDLRLNADNFLVLKSVANWDMHSRYQKDKTEKLYKISGRLNSNTKVQKCIFQLIGRSQQLLSGILKKTRLIYRQKQFKVQVWHQIHNSGKSFVSG